LESTAITIRNSKGEVDKLVIVNRDVTARKEVEQKLGMMSCTMHSPDFRIAGSSWNAFSGDSRKPSVLRIFAMPYC